MLHEKRFIISLLIIFSFLPLPLSADIIIDSATFPDSSFRTFLLDKNYGDDGIITDAELTGITEITNMYGGSPRYTDISSLKGIEQFHALEHLTLFGCSIVDDVDLSALHQLKTVQLHNDKIRALNVSGCTSLEYLDCSENSLSSLDLTNNTLLKYVRVEDNNLTALDLSHCPSLLTLSCDNNSLESLNLDVNKALESIYVSGNSITSLNVSQQTQLRNLYCNHNQLTSLYLPTQHHLEEVRCHNNSFTGAAMSGLIASLPAGNEGKLFVISVWDEMERNGCTYKQVNEITAKGWKVLCLNNCTHEAREQEYQGSPVENVTYDGFNVDDCVAITPSNFEDLCTHVRMQASSHDGYLSPSEIAAVTSLYFSDTHQGGSLKGIEHFTKLTTLSCGKNSIGGNIDLTKNTELTRFECSHNHLTSLSLEGLQKLTYVDCTYSYLETLNITGCSALLTLYCHNNRLRSLNCDGCVALTTLYCSDTFISDLDVSGAVNLETLLANSCDIHQIDLHKNTELRRLEIDDNGLTTLDLTSNMKLSSLHCSYNILTSLDVSNHSALLELLCNNNKLSELQISGTNIIRLGCAMNDLHDGAIDNLVACLPTRSWGCRIDGIRANYINNSSEPELNVWTKTQVLNARRKGYDVYDDTYPYDGSGADIEKDEIGIPLSEFPDEAFQDKLYPYIAYGKYYDVFPYDRLDTVKELSFEWGNLTSLKGIEYLTALERLSCLHVNVPELDLSHNLKLNYLNIDCHASSLNISKNSELEMLYCSDNALTSLQLPLNSKCKKISCGGNLITSLDVSTCPQLEILWCENNRISHLNVANTSLKEIKCATNNLNGRGMDDFINSLPTTDGGVIKMLDDAGGQNICNQSHVATAKQKGWSIQIWKRSYAQWFDYVPDDNSPFRPFDSIEYYFLNEGCGLYLTQGNSWDTQASLGVAGLSIFIRYADEGQPHEINGVKSAICTLDTHIHNSETAHYLNTLDNDATQVYCDQESGTWYLVPQADGTYLITKDGSRYLTYDGSTTVLRFTSSPAKNAHWRIMSREDIIVGMLNATNEHPVNATPLIEYSNFGRNGSALFNKWNVYNCTLSINGNNDNWCGEVFNSRAWVDQQLNDIPNGKYLLKAQGFYREGTYDKNADLYLSNAEHHYAKLFANSDECSIHSIFDGANQCDGYDGVETSAGRIPDNMSDAATAFRNNLYWNEVPVTVTNGMLRLGIKKETFVSRDWTIFDNFQLIYYGKDTPTAIEPSVSTLPYNDKKIYDLSGRLISNSPLRPGIYLRNGKKFIIR